MIRNRIMLGVLLIVSFIPLIIFGGKVPYVIFFSILLLPMLSISYTCIQYGLLDIYQRMENKEVLKGESFKYFSSLCNLGPLFYPYVKVDFSGSDSIFADQFQTKFFTINPLSKIKFSYDLEFKYRGSYTIGIETVEIGDFLGVFSLKRRLYKAKDINVMPRVIKLNHFLLKPSCVSESDTNLNSHQEDTSVISDIRKYTHSDSLRKIHWKLSSKMGELMSKNCQPTVQTDAIILLDLRKSDLAVSESIIVEDKIIESTLAIIYYCLSKCVPIKLIFHHNTILDLKGGSLADFERFYTVLSTIPFKENINISDIIDVYYNESKQDSNIIVVTPQLNYNLFDRLYKYSTSGYNISLIYICPDELSDNMNQDTQKILSFLAEINVSTYTINISDEIKIVLESL